LLFLAGVEQSRQCVAKRVTSPTPPIWCSPYCSCRTRTFSSQGTSGVRSKTSTDPIHVIGGLHEALFDRRGQGFVQELELDDHPLYRAIKTLGFIQGPLYQQIGTPTAQPIFPIDPPTTVDDALQERLQR